MSKDLSRGHPRVSYELRFLDLRTDDDASHDGPDAPIDARGVLTGVRLEPVGSDGVPQLGGDVDIEYETPAGPPALRRPELARDDASTVGAFTTWDRPPAAVTSVEPPVVTDPGLAEGEEAGEVTEIVPRPSSRKAKVVSFDRVPAWGFAMVAMVAFGVMYAGISRVRPASEGNRQAEAATSGPSDGSPRTNPVGALQPLIIRASASPAGAGAGAPATAATSVAKSAPASADLPVPAPAPVAPVAGVDAAAASPQARVRPRASQLRTLRTPSVDAGTTLRGIDVPVESSALYLEVTLPHPESDGKFGVRVTPSWPTTLAIVGKSTNGFTVSFGTPAPADAHLDWLLVRRARGSERAPASDAVIDR